jgi:hypothetical protein
MLCSTNIDLFIERASLDARPLWFRRIEVPQTIPASTTKDTSPYTSGFRRALEASEVDERAT